MDPIPEVAVDCLKENVRKPLILLVETKGFEPSTS